MALYRPVLIVLILFSYNLFAIDNDFRIKKSVDIPYHDNFLKYGIINIQTNDLIEKSIQQNNLQKKSARKQSLKIVGEVFAGYGTGIILFTIGIYTGKAISKEKSSLLPSSEGIVLGTLGYVVGSALGV